MLYFRYNATSFVSAIAIQCINSENDLDQFC